jgi:TolA-binding protein
MQIKRELERRIEKKQQEIAELKQQLGNAETYLEALQDTLKLLPKEGDKEIVLRAGSDLARARDFIKSKGCPQHVNDILKGINKEPNNANKTSLSGSLGGYVRKGVIFTKPAPNTFGLIELENDKEPKIETDPMVTLESLQKATY